MPVAYTPLAHASFLDYDSYRSAAPLPTATGPAAAVTFNVALILDRANDPGALLSGDWAARQAALAALEQGGTLWSTYGADPAIHAQVIDAVAALGLQTVDDVDPVNGYVGSAASRTVWVQVDQDSFATLFGTPLLAGQDEAGNGLTFWQGDLSLPEPLAALGVKGLWFDTHLFGTVLPAARPVAAASLPQGSQSPGNGLPKGEFALFPQQIAQDYYDFPLAGALWDPTSGAAVPTGTIALLAPGAGDALDGDAPPGAFQARLDAYRRAAGIATPGVVSSVAPGGQQPVDEPERTLDLAIVTTINPQSPVVLYAGSGFAAGATAGAYTAYQAAIFDSLNDPEVISSSYRFHPTMAAPGSPFLWAVDQLFVDGALANVSIVTSGGDGGSGGWTGNGLTNLINTRGSPYDLAVGGTSLSMRAAAEQDGTLDDLVAAALAGDQATIWDLVAGGLTVLPAHAGDGAFLVETVWNTYALDGTTFANNGYLGNYAGGGGADPSHPVPDYQRDFGLEPRTADPVGLVGRGLPDVSAVAGGNLTYAVPFGDLTGLHGGGGTSGSAPLWGALLSQIDALFNDQGLRDLGYAHDLLYVAAAIAPASFNDVTIGNNVSSFVLGGDYRDAQTGTPITPTGYGYEAGPGYDLATGLGTPNGLLLARAMTAVAHAQTSFAGTPDVVEAGAAGGWRSAARQGLLVQVTAPAGVAVEGRLGGERFALASPAAAAFAWSARFAGQTLQAGFDPALATLFDRQAQGGLGYVDLSAGERLALTIGGRAARAAQATLTSPFGFVDFATPEGTVRLARPVAVAETAGGQDDQVAIVRLRQGGEDRLAVSFYRVDDLEGTIGGLRPGEAGYAAAAAARRYATEGGRRAIAGPGFGGYAQAALVDVDAGDVIAMSLANLTHGDTWWGFAAANAAAAGGDGTGHLWAYAHNTWGWEDTRGGGDRDFNDLVVQLDFTSAAGHGWIA